MEDLDLINLSVVRERTPGRLSTITNLLVSRNVRYVSSGVRDGEGLMV